MTEDPSYGLPGLTTIDEEVPFKYEKIKRLSVILRPLDSITRITASKWATRGWTYQEGYLSRKRIFFTNKNDHFICNASTTSAALHRFLPRAGQRPRPLKVYSEVSDWTYRLAPFTRNLEAYSSRQLSVDSDALDAITGALNDQMVNEKPVHHLWGIPIFETDIDYDLGPLKKFSKGRIQHGTRECPVIEFLLHWNHSRPCRRRSEFPSWSFLGWAGRIDYLAWPRQTHIGEHFIVHNLQAAGHAKFALTPTGTHYLDVTTSTIPLALVDVKCPVDTTQNGYYAVARLDANTEAYVQVHWSRDPGSIRREGSTLTGALFIDERKLLKEISSTTSFVLEGNGNRYERIGSCTIFSMQLKTLPDTVRTMSGSSVIVKSWEYKEVRMQEWQKRATRERILIG
ncbi:hypothetical protein BU25DRAFT_86537 [Macroventuria anomochaeta]|uniref:Uncharacterized protein n=1 Tax=Macroventuria anomochaeta TaxID=301207 RepID=A0ACB6SF44_9PLEO|nr:uncharacterized protein BU25DRAFT_86537 [Macroventuria anomochaeta]KAF2632946.1 hypothetical protein BU25DRAFT_86537 [Macroventuria anomochaeta]